MKIISENNIQANLWQVLCNQRCSTLILNQSLIQTKNLLMFLFWRCYKPFTGIKVYHRGKLDIHLEMVNPLD